MESVKQIEEKLLNINYRIDMLEDEKQKLMFKLQEKMKEERSNE